MRNKLLLLSLVIFICIGYISRTCSVELPDDYDGNELGVSEESSSHNISSSDGAYGTFPNLGLLDRDVFDDYEHNHYESHDSDSDGHDNYDDDESHDTDHSYESSNSSSEHSHDSDDDHDKDVHGWDGMKFNDNDHYEDSHHDSDDLNYLFGRNDAFSHDNDHDHEHDHDSDKDSSSASVSSDKSHQNSHHSDERDSYDIFSQHYPQFMGVDKVFNPPTHIPDPDPVHNPSTHGHSSSGSSSHPPPSPPSHPPPSHPPPPPPHKSSHDHKKDNHHDTKDEHKSHHDPKKHGTVSHSVSKTHESKSSCHSTTKDCHTSSSTHKTHSSLSDKSKHDSKHKTSPTSKHDSKHKTSPTSKYDSKHKTSPTSKYHTPSGSCSYSKHDPKSQPCSHSKYDTTKSKSDTHKSGTTTSKSDTHKSGTTTSKSDPHKTDTTKSKSDSSVSDKNNVILIMADDMSIDFLRVYEKDLHGRHRHKFANTPNIDKLAKDGLVFRRAYAYPNCSPTRSSILTGRFAFRTKITYPIGRVCSQGLEYPQPTIPLSLPKEAKKGIFGKWHLASIVNNTMDIMHVQKAGFNYYDGMMGGAIPPSKNGYYDWLRQTPKNVKGENEKGYFTTEITDIAIKWVKAHQKYQFFLWMAHLAPQPPIHTPPSNLVHDAPKTCHMGVNATQGALCAMAVLESLDTEIGRLLDAVDVEVRKRTTIIFLSDNGPDNSYADGKPYKQNRVKNTLYEGGIKIPLIISGNKVLSKGKSTYSLASTVDLYATIVEIMGGHPNIMEKLDTVSLVPVLKDYRSTVRNFVFVELKGPNKTCTSPETNIKYDYGDAFIHNQYKLITKIDYAPDNTIKLLPHEFYDVYKDPFEEKNLLHHDSKLTDEQKGALELIKARRLKLLKT